MTTTSTELYEDLIEARLSPDPVIVKRLEDTLDGGTHVRGDYEISGRGFRKKGVTKAPFSLLKIVHLGTI